MNLRPIIEAAQQPSQWDFSNQQLYRLCRDHPRHDRAEVVIAKVLLIGRAYAAAIERRKTDLGRSGDEFYLKRVAPAIMRSPIDQWIHEARRQKPGTPEALAVMVGVHGRTTDLFSSISGLEKRSLASKYLHFHVPGLFFIYDSRAVQGMRRVAAVVGGTHASRDGRADRQYAPFAQKCWDLSQYVTRELDKTLTPRQLDNVLLTMSAKHQR